FLVQLDSGTAAVLPVIRHGNVIGICAPGRSQRSLALRRRNGPGNRRALPGLFRLVRYFQRHFADCRRQPRPGLVTALVQAEQDGDKLSENELLAMAFLLLVAGHETTVHLLSGGILALLQFPE